MEPIKTEEDIEFLRESNAIENEYSDEALEDAWEAWYYLKGTPQFKIVTIPKIEKVHQLLMWRLNPDIAGRLRKQPVYISKRGGCVECLDWQLIEPKLKKLCRTKPITEEEIKQWHIKFEKIHPFVDGNGRTGRILMNFQRKIAGLPLLIIHKGEEQQEYYKWFR